MDNRFVMFILGFLAASLLYLALRPVPAPASPPPAAQQTDSGVALVPMGEDRFLVTMANSYSGLYGQFAVVSVTEGKVEVVAQGNWRPFLEPAR